MTPQLDPNVARCFLYGLNLQDLQQLALQLMVFPGSRPFYENAAREWWKGHNFPCIEEVGK